jgi:pyruvate formate lyase activating enzyme
LDKKGIPIWIRHVIVPGITLYKEYLERLGEFMPTLGNVKALDVLPYHSMGKVKYESLGMEYPLAETREATKQEAVAAKNIILGAYKKAKKDN